MAMTPPGDNPTRSDACEGASPPRSRGWTSVEQARLIAAIIDSANDAIIGKSLAGIVTSWNGGAEKLYGYPAEVMLGRTILAIVAPEEREALRAMHARIAQGEPVPHFESRRVTAGGRVLDVSLSLSPIRNDAGEVIGIAAIERDVTAHEQATTALRLAQAEAAERAAELTKEREVSALKDEFVNNVSHELRSPLNVIYGYLDLLEDQVAGPLLPTQAEYARKIGEAAQRLQNLVEDLLDTARIDAGAFEVLLRTCDPGAQVRETIALLTPQLQKAGLVVKVDIAPTLPPLRCDPRRVGQVLGNLIGNAIQFTPVGGTLTVRLRGDAAGVRFEVQDTGDGIAAEDVPKLFKRFGQLSAGRMRGGTGLGLAISKSIVEAHGGAIGVESQPGHGSTFWFTLPAALPG